MLKRIAELSLRLLSGLRKRDAKDAPLRLRRRGRGRVQFNSAYTAIPTPDLVDDICLRRGARHTARQYRQKDDG
jgi:hypothetical protein